MDGVATPSFAVQVPACAFKLIVVPLFYVTFLLSASKLQIFKSSFLRLFLTISVTPISEGIKC